LIVSELGARPPEHGLDLSAVTFKDGDRAGSAQECRSVDSLVIISSEGRAFTIPVAALPDGRGMGAPLTSFVDMGGGKIAHVLTGKPETSCWSPRLRATASSAPTPTCSRQKAGKAS
jgi:topoisomerase-4 subunit A